MNYGSQPVDPWSWDLGDESGSINNGGMNVQRPTSKPHPPESQLYHRSGGWPHPEQHPGSYPRPNGSLPQVPRQSHQPEQPHYNDPNIFAAGQGHNGADFFDSFVTNNSNMSGWGQENQWGPQNNPPVSNHLPAGSQAENNEIAPPDTDYNRTSFSGYSNVHTEKNANFSYGDTANANVHPHHPAQSRPQRPVGGSDNQEVPVAQGWDWGDSSSSKEPTPPPPLTKLEPAPPQNSEAKMIQQSMQVVQTYQQNNQEVTSAQRWGGWGESSKEPSLPPVTLNDPRRPPAQNYNDHSATRASPVAPNDPRRPPTQNYIDHSAPSDSLQRRGDSEGPSSQDHNGQSAPTHHVLTSPFNTENIMQPFFRSSPSPDTVSLKLQQPIAKEPSNRIMDQNKPDLEENNSVLNQFPTQRSSNQSSGIVPSDSWNLQTPIYRSQIPPNHNDVSQMKSPQFVSLEEVGNQAVPPPVDMAKSRGQNFKQSGTPKPINHGFTTPDSRNNNPFIDDTHSMSSLYPIGSSTPTRLPDKPENEEVPSKQDNLPQRMSALNIEEPLSVVTPSQDDTKPETQNQEAPPAKGPLLLVSDRNQYLETGHLSAPKDNEDTSLQDLADESDAPPPGLDRMVTGQQREPIAPPSDVDIVSNAATAGSYILGASSTSSVASEAEGRKGGSEEGDDVEPESQRLVQGESTAEEQSYLPGPTGHREVPGEAEPMRGRVVLGQMGRGTTPPLMQDQPSPRSDRVRSDQEIGERMVVGERTEPPQANSTQDDFRQPHRPRHRHPRGESSFDEEDRDYSSDRDRRDRDRGDYKRDDRPRRRRDDRHRSPEYRSDEEYEDKRPYQRGNRERDRRDRRDRDRDRDREYSPDRDYYYSHRDYHHDPRDRRPRRYDNRDREYHHREYEDDYYYTTRDHRSRPSSRTGSDYRRFNVSSDYAARSRHYYPDTSMLMNTSMTMNSSGFPDLSKVDPRAYAEYLETMRRVDPAGYAAWYSQYMANRSLYQSGAFNNDRASVHSGQSSSNQRQAVQSPTAAVDEDKEEDYTPRLYTTAHVRGKIDNYGRLLVVDPHYPMDGQRASISLYQMSSFPIPDADMEEFLEAPGPFIPGITHRSTVLHYLKRMSQNSQKNSEKLLYDLIHLIVKGNGEINGCDISELLMNSFKKCTYDEERRDGEGDGAISQAEVITRFRELLIQGNKLEALEWAIDRGAWGHALFLSSKMDPKTHKDVMFRFVDSISQNDPIRTLYQMMSGHIPHASECCGDKQWSDWRPHLAMILGNPTANSKIDRKSIIRLGDALSAKGRVYAAHFCYITAQVELTAYKPSAKLVLLGANSKLDNPLLASCRSIMLTVCYEYGLKLKQIDFSVPSLQLYKLILTTRLIDIGRNKIALQYCQLMALEALQCGNYDRSVMCQVVDLASRLKMLEPSLALSGDVHAEPEWLEKLRANYENLPEDYDSRVELRPSASSSTISEAGQDVVSELLQPIAEARNMTTTITQPLYDPYAYNQELTVTSDSLPQPYVPQPLQLVNEEQDYNSGSVMNPPPLPNQYMEPAPGMSTGHGYGQEQNYWDNNANQGMVGLDNNSVGNNAYEYPNTEAPSTPVKPKNDFFKATEEQLKLTEVSNNAGNNKQPEPNQAQQHQQQGAKGDEQKSGWFGGFLDKLSMRPKNQMKLPDDKNPSIVWDKEKKKWVNLDGESETRNAVKPPPKAFEMGGAVQPSNHFPAGGPTPAGAPLVQNSGPTSLPPPSSNKYKLQKGLMKKNYVDVMSKSSNSSQSQPPSLDGYMPLVPPAPQQQPTFFTPSRVEGMDNAPYDFITPSSNPRLPESSSDDVPIQPQLSRCSSVSSLSREVQYYMDPRGPSGNKFKAAPAQAPMMYNRSQMQ